MLGIYLLLGKTNYVEIALNTIESEHGNISCSELEVIRLNAFVRYSTGNDNDGRKHNKIALDECQEMVNWLTKKLPLSSDQER